MLGARLRIESESLMRITYGRQVDMWTVTLRQPSEFSRTWAMNVLTRCLRCTVVQGCPVLLSNLILWHSCPTIMDLRRHLCEIEVTDSTNIEPNRVRLRWAKELLPDMD